MVVISIVSVRTLPYGQLVTVGAHEEMVRTVVVVIVEVVYEGVWDEEDEEDTEDAE